MNTISQKYFDIGECIYCHKKECKLTTEHVIPFALDGTLTLRNSCCENCRAITSKCERNPLNENWAEVRACLDYPSRKRNFENEDFKLEVVLRNGNKETLSLKKSEILGITQFLEYGLPTILTNQISQNGITVRGVSTFGFGVNLDEFIEKHNIKQFSYSAKYKQNFFETMLAKIAYGFVIACWGTECFEECFVLPSILRKTDNIGLWVGCDFEEKILPKIGIQNGKNILKLGIFEPAKSDKQLIIVRLKFFANTATPEYLVVVGTLNKEFKK
ncbi:hypothetical protein CVV38_00335 [Candidatus Peregrinibacteria bacterium HGW-Peregrinibacteria-1]|jgi:hypothetical protein|nr:MAG: hypothetical protein CVV38_00335 [Candidatus Peregrinibacteria bacterium HGW-Peregrinibacteria-1]